MPARFYVFRRIKSRKLLLQSFKNSNAGFLGKDVR